MPATRPAQRQDHRLAFLRGFLTRPKEVGSIIPSSRFMEKRIVNTARLREAKLAIELGPGTGGTTKAFLRAMAPDAKLLAIEINPDFVKLLNETIDDDRLIVHEGSAADIPSALGKYGLDTPEVILSGIPFSTMDRELGLSILQSVHDALPKHGRFVAYQFRDRVETLGNNVFGQANVQTELLNVPPMRVYRWEKTED
ncbi:MAG: rRNA adenine N-6-methyltransferase family protein [Myxococcota bacterium]|jgi:phospholipid N-methyltransferase|nr:rRNA adenine N-6-methyltransferase family protein [Myxococcota bacterium]